MATSSSTSKTSAILYAIMVVIFLRWWLEGRKSGTVEAATTINIQHHPKDSLITYFKTLNLSEPTLEKVRSIIDEATVPPDEITWNPVQILNSKFNNKSKLFFPVE